MQSLKLKPELIKLSKNERLYNLSIPIIGLTGGIACGKSTVAQYFKDLGIEVIDADKIVHKIYKNPETHKFISELAPDCINEQGIDFKNLREKFFKDPTLKEKIQTYIYGKMPTYILDEISKIQHCSFIIYDVPLLFENQLQTKLDATITVYCPRDIQLERLMKRDAILAELANSILDQQMDIELKRQLAQYVLDNSTTLTDLSSQFQALTSSLFQ